MYKINNFTLSFLIYAYRYMIYIYIFNFCSSCSFNNYVRIYTLVSFLFSRHVGLKMRRNKTLTFVFCFVANNVSIVIFSSYSSYQTIIYFSVHF